MTPHEEGTGFVFLLVYIGIMVWVGMNLESPPRMSLAPKIQDLAKELVASSPHSSSLSRWSMFTTLSTTPSPVMRRTLPS